MLLCYQNSLIDKFNFFLDLIFNFSALNKKYTKTKFTHISSIF